MPLPLMPERPLNIIVTGGGRGLGWEMADALVADGHRVVVTGARASEELSQSCQVWNQDQSQPRAVAEVADVADWDDCQRVARRCVDEFGSVDVLINNAGRGMLEISPDFNTRPALFWQADPQGVANILQANVQGSFLMARACVPLMVAQGWGRVVNISTSQVTMVRTGYCPYGPSKAALEAMSVIWAKDLAGTGVSVNVLLPGGAADTRLLPGFGPDRRGADGNLLSPALMRAPIEYLVRAPAELTGRRYTARLWNTALPPQEAAAGAQSPSQPLPALM